MSKANPMAATTQMTHWIGVIRSLLEDTPEASAIGVIENHTADRGLDTTFRRRFMLSVLLKSWCLTELGSTACRSGIGFAPPGEAERELSLRLSVSAV